MFRLIYICLLLWLVCNDAFPQGASRRIQWSINDNWKFLPEGADFAQRPKTDDTKWKLVNIPHTWNAEDPFDDDEVSRRGISWYRKKLVLDERFKDKKVYIHFEGAYQVADVYVNGVFAGQHKGGYTAFNFDITHLLKLGDKPVENLIAVQLNNAQDNFVPPLSVGYASYGGIYRDVWLIATGKLHFKTLDHASPGIFISTPQVSNNNATLNIKGSVSNDTDTEQKLEVIHTVYDAAKKVVTILRKQLSVAPLAEAAFDINSSEISNPHLWSPDAPYLYQVKSQLLENGQITDEVINPLGFRWFNFDPDKGFSLNGKHLQLRGTNRHQDIKGRGDAISDQDHYRDLKLIKDMGCNFLRLAHYPQDPEVLRLADEMGLLIWEEIPLVNYMNPNPEFLENSKNMIREMIRQNYNHPSVIIWGSMNEVLLWSEMAERIQVQNNMEYIAKVKAYSIQLDSTVRQEDPGRYSAIAMHMSDDYDKFGMSGISMIAGYNMYNGWYSGVANEFGPTIDKKHKANPGQILLISEYGAEADNRVNTEKPARFDWTGQYQRYYHESYLDQINKRPYLAGTAVWNQFDFSQPNVGGVSNNLNQKGLITWDRQPKDSYYMYKANWNPEPMVYVATRDWLNRAGVDGGKSTIEVYSNLGEVSLTVNGKSYGRKKPDHINKAVWQVTLQEGLNTVFTSAKSGSTSVSDQVVINYLAYHEKLQGSTEPFRQLSVNVGSNTQYLDMSDNIWIEDRPYSKGSFGVLGGSPATMYIKTVKKNTEYTPLFYSYQDDLKGYRFDVPDGVYELELAFIENQKMDAGDRVFDVAINEDIVLNDLDLTAEAGFAVAIMKKYIVTVTNGDGIQVSFAAKKGKPVLSGIRIKAK